MKALTAETKPFSKEGFLGRLNYNQMMEATTIVSEQLAIEDETVKLDGRRRALAARIERFNTAQKNVNSQLRFNMCDFSDRVRVEMDDGQGVPIPIKE